MSIGESKANGDNIENVAKSLSIEKKKLNKFNLQKPIFEDGERSILEDEITLELLNSYIKISKF